MLAPKDVIIDSWVNDRLKRIENEIDRKLIESKALNEYGVFVQVGDYPESVISRIDELINGYRALGWNCRRSPNWNEDESYRAVMIVFDIPLKDIDPQHKSTQTKIHEY